MEGRLRRHGEQAADRGRRPEPIDHRVQRCVGEHVRVVGQEHVLVLDEVTHPTQPLADRRVEPGVDERDRPVLDVAAEQLDVATAQDEVVAGRLGVGEEEVLDVMRTVAQAQHEVRVSEVRVVAHDVPDQRPRSDLVHRLGQVGDAVAHPHAVPTAEQDDLHPQTTSRVGIGKTRRPPHSRIVRQLLGQLGAQVPRQHQHVVGPVFRDPLRGQRSGSGCPGVNRPCLYGLRSTVYASRSGRMPQ